MKSKTSWRHHFTKHRIVKITLHYQIWSHQNSHILLLVEMKNGKMSSSYKVKPTLPLWCRNPNPSYLLRRHENVYPQKYLCRNFQGSFIHTSQKCKQPECLSTGDWINTLCYIYTVEYYSAIIKNTLLIHIMIQVNIRNTMLTRVSQTQAYALSDFIYILFSLWIGAPQGEEFLCLLLAVVSSTTRMVPGTHVLLSRYMNTC